MKIYKISHGWGNRIEFSNWENRRVSGHKQDIPSVGDILEAEMESGKTARFEFSEVKRCWDPPDMFFGTVKDIGYKP